MVISIATQKGGTGKTTTAVNLASGLAKLKNKKVLLIDIDQQANASDILLDNYSEMENSEDGYQYTIYETIVNKGDLNIHESKVPNLSIVPSHIVLADVDTKLGLEKDHKEARLKKALDKVKEDYDYVIIDCPPALGWLTINALVASDKAIVVVAPGRFELTSINKFSDTLEFIQEAFEHDIELLGFLFNKKAPNLTSKESLLALRNAYPSLVFKTVIPKNTEVEKATMNGLNVFDHNPNCPYAQEMVRFLDEVISKTKV